MSYKLGRSFPSPDNYSEFEEGKEKPHRREGRIQIVQRTTTQKRYETERGPHKVIEQKRGIQHYIGGPEQSEKREKGGGGTHKRKK